MPASESRHFFSFGASLMAGRKPMPACERFDEKVVKQADECWLFVGHGTNNGYGIFSVGKKIMTAHRFAWEREHGPIPEGLDICHTCDVRRCVNPEHLFAGTRLDNMRDCVAKGRQRKGPRPAQQGEKHHLSKLTADAVRSIRQSYSERASQTELAQRHGVSVQQIHRIVHRQLWTHI